MRLLILKLKKPKALMKTKPGLRRIIQGVKGGPGSGNWGHAGRPGIVGGSSASSMIASVIDPNLDDFFPGAAEMIQEQLHGVPEKHLKGLKEITVEAPEGWDDYDNPKIDEYFVGEKGKANGVYVQRTNTIHVHPAALETEGITLVHELGHHVTRHSLGWKAELSKLTKQTAIDLAASDIMPKDLANMGIRRYSLTNGAEFLADSYVVWLRGSDAQWSNLNSYVTSAMGSNFDMTRVFGERGK